MKCRLLTGFILFVMFLMIVFCTYSECLYPCSVDNKYGFCDESRNVVIEPIWDYVSYFRDQKTAVIGQLDEKGTLLMGIIDIFGTVIVPCRYIIKEGEDELFGGPDGFYSVQDPETKCYGYYDIRNDVDIRCRDEYGLLPVIDPVTNKQGMIIDKNGYAIFHASILNAILLMADYQLRFQKKGNIGYCMHPEKKRNIRPVFTR